jgi:hypothetical protein
MRRSYRGWLMSGVSHMTVHRMLGPMAQRTLAAIVNRAIFYGYGGQ